jgi:hypothetical protein
MTTLRVTGADDTRGRFVARPAVLTPGTPPPPAVWAVTTLSGALAIECIAVLSGTLSLAGALPILAVGASAAANPAVVRVDCALTSEPGRGWCISDLSSSPKKSIPKSPACAGAAASKPGPMTIVHDAKAQPMAALRNLHPSKLAPHGQPTAGFDLTTPT